jgi:hypothetical protein
VVLQSLADALARVIYAALPSAALVAVFLVARLLQLGAKEPTDLGQIRGTHPRHAGWHTHAQASVAQDDPSGHHRVWVVVRSPAGTVGIGVAVSGPSLPA